MMFVTGFIKKHEIKMHSRPCFSIFNFKNTKSGVKLYGSVYSVVFLFIVGHVTANTTPSRYNKGMYKVSKFSSL